MRVLFWGQRHMNGTEEDAHRQSRWPVIAAVLVDLIVSLVIASVIVEAIGIRPRGYGDLHGQVSRLAGVLYPCFSYLGVVSSLGRWSLGVRVDRANWREVLDREFAVSGVFGISRQLQVLRIAAVAGLVFTIAVIIDA